MSFNLYSSFDESDNSNRENFMQIIGLGRFPVWLMLLVQSALIVNEYKKQPQNIPNKLYLWACSGIVISIPWLHVYYLIFFRDKLKYFEQPPYYNYLYELELYIYTFFLIGLGGWSVSVPNVSVRNGGAASILLGTGYLLVNRWILATENTRTKIKDILFALPRRLVYMVRSFPLYIDREEQNLRYVRNNFNSEDIIDETPLYNTLYTRYVIYIGYVIRAMILVQCGIILDAYHKQPENVSNVSKRLYQTALVGMIIFLFLWLLEWKWRKWRKSREIELYLSMLFLFILGTWCITVREHPKTMYNCGIASIAISTGGFLINRWRLPVLYRNLVHEKQVERSKENFNTIKIFLDKWLKENKKTWKDLDGLDNKDCTLAGIKKRCEQEWWSKTLTIDEEDGSITTKVETYKYDPWRQSVVNIGNEPGTQNVDLLQNCLKTLLEPKVENP